MHVLAKHQSKRTNMATLNISTIKTLHEKTKTSETGKKLYTDDFKQMVIKFHYQSGMHLQTIADKTEISMFNLPRWKRTYGTDQTAFIFGTKIRNDVRTKCLAVREAIEFNKDQIDLAIKYRVSVQSINTWINKYKDIYLTLIDAPDGIPYIVKEKKMVFGQSNIDKVRAMLNAQANELLSLIETMHMSGSQAEAMRKVAEETLAKEESLVEAVELLGNNGINIK